jgi:hypothetical protein
MPREQSRQPLGQVPLAPAIDESIVAIKLLADRCPRLSRIKQQDQPCPARIVGAS